MDTEGARALLLPKRIRTNPAASNPGRPRGTGNLTQQLLGEYENLPNQVIDEEWPPDEGPRFFDPRHGAATVAARSHLICFNVNLGSRDVSIREADREGGTSEQRWVP